MDTKEILRRLQLAQSDRQRFEPIYNDAIRLTMPGRRRFYDTDVVNSAEDIFDETGANAVAEFVSRMFAGICPPFSKFVRLEASSLVDPRDAPAINRDLDEITEFAFEEIWSSNFSQEATEAFYDMAYSTGTLLVEEGTGGKSLHHKAIPMTESFFEAGPDGSIGGHFRCTKVEARHLEARYPKAKLGADLQRIVASDPAKKLDVIEYTFAVPGRVEKTHHIVMVKEPAAIIIERTLTGYGSNPFISFGWSSTAGEVLRRGPLMNALAAVRTTNLMVELVLENAAMSIVGMYQTDNDATINSENVTLLPGTILAKEPGTNGLEPVMAATGNFNMQDLVMNDQRLNIRRALYNDLLSDPNKTPATATEVAERMADLAYRSSAGFSRLFYEFVQPYFLRVLRILEKRGDIALPVKNRQAIRFRAVSPLAQAQYGRDIQALVQGHNITAMIFGSQAASAQYEIEKLLPWLQQRGGLDEQLFKHPRKMVEAIEQGAAQMAQMQAQAQAQGGA